MCVCVCVRAKVLKALETAFVLRYTKQNVRTVVCAVVFQQSLR